MYSSKGIKVAKNPYPNSLPGKSHTTALQYPGKGTGVWEENTGTRHSLPVKWHIRKKRLCASSPLSSPSLEPSCIKKGRRERQRGKVGERGKVGDE